MSLDNPKRTVKQHLFIHLILIGLSALFILPLGWMLSTSLKPIEETMKEEIEWLPKRQLEHTYRDPESPLYETEYQGQLVQGSLTPDGKMKIEQPTVFQTIEFTITDHQLTEIDRSGKLVDLFVEGQMARGFVKDRIDDDVMVEVIKPEQFVGQSGRQQRVTFFA